jgi:hypothetical protein
MSALAMILMAAMAVPAIGPERESGDVAEPQRLDLNGEWQGIWKVNPKGETESIGYKDGSIYVAAGHFDAKIVDDGNGRLHFTQRWQGYIGIYRQDGPDLTICFCDRRYGWPTSFRIAMADTNFSSSTASSPANHRSKVNG